MNVFKLNLVHLAISYCETRSQRSCTSDDMDSGSLWLTPGKTGHKTANSNCVLLQLGVIDDMHMTWQLTHAHRISSRVRPLPITNTFTS